jgi:hypothetical protein
MLFDEHGLLGGNSPLIQWSPIFLESHSIHFKHLTLNYKNELRELRAENKIETARKTGLGTGNGSLRSSWLFRHIFYGSKLFNLGWIK